MSDPGTANTPLTCAVESNVSLVQFLLDHGADPNFHDAKGPTALKIAIRKKNEALIGLFLSAHADPNEVDYEQGFVGSGAAAGDGFPGCSPLFQAVSLGDEAAAGALLAHGAHVDSLESNGLVALDRAVTVSPAIVRLLLDHGASPVRPPATATPLHYSIGRAPHLGESASETVPGMRIIHSVGRPLAGPIFPRAAQPQVPNASVVSGAEASAQMKPILEIWAMLLAKGAEINAADAKGMTPLHYAARNEQIPLDALAWLIGRGADARAKDSDGRTPLDYLPEGERAEIEKALQPAR
jgi:ankyrin repeat protein